MNDQFNKKEVNSYIFDVSENDFANKVIEASDKKIIIVDFWAPWCEPCKQLGPLLEEVVNDCKGLVSLAKMNIDENPHTPTKYGVRGIPTLMVFKGGEVVETKVGGMSKAQLTEWANNAV